MEQKKKVLFVATVVKTHINTFHLPFLKMFKEYEWEVHVAAKNDFVDEPCVIGGDVSDKESVLESTVRCVVVRHA